MSKTKLLGIAVIGLLMLNFGILGFLVFRKPPHPGERMHGRLQDGPRNIIIERLHFDKEQVAQYELLINEHQGAMRRLRDSIENTKNILYETLNSEPAKDGDLLVNKLGMLQKEIEQTHYKHFTALKKICRPDQMERFKKLTSELAIFFAPGKNGPLQPRN